MARKATWTSLTDSELIEQLSEAKDEVFKLRFQIVTGRLDNTARLKQAKKEVARAMTELRTREIQAAEAQEARMLDAQAQSRTQQAQETQAQSRTQQAEAQQAQTQESRTQEAQMQEAGNG